MDREIEKTFRIGYIAKKLDVSVETIRTYERQGFLVPFKTETGQRLFTDRDVEWAQCIRKLIKRDGLNFEGIRRLLGNSWSPRRSSRPRGPGGGRVPLIRG